MGVSGLSATPDAIAVRRGTEGEICQTCGSVLVGETCPVCYQRSYFDSSSPTSEAGLTSNEYSKVLGREGVSKRERNFLNSLTFDNDDRKIHDEVERLLRPFGSRPNDLQLVEELARSYRKQGQSIRNASAAAVVKHKTDNGLSLVEVVRNLGAAEPELVAIGSLEVRLFSSNNDDIRARINGFIRNAKLSRIGELVCYGERGAVWVARVPLTVMDQGGILTFDNAQVLRVTKGNKNVDARAGGLDGRGIRLKIDARKCFVPFKILKKLHVDFSAEPRNLASVHRSHVRVSPLSAMPCTEMLLRESGYISKLQLSFYRKFQERMKDASGRSPISVAKEALLEASKELFWSLNDYERLLVHAGAVRLSSAVRDADWKEEDGFVFRGELKRYGA
jgi:hypothetical protein